MLTPNRNTGVVEYFLDILVSILDSVDPFSKTAEQYFNLLGDVVSGCEALKIKAQCVTGRLIDMIEAHPFVEV